MSNLCVNVDHFKKFLDYVVLLIIPMSNNNTFCFLHFLINHNKFIRASHLTRASFVDLHEEVV